MKFEEKDIIYNDSSTTQIELFNMVEKILLKEKVVKDGYAKALEERETKYPTGLGLNNFNVAICHADPKYSKKNRILLVKLKKPIEFNSMDTMEPIDVEHVFFLVLKNGEDHIDILKKIALVMQDIEGINEIKKSKNKEELLEVINTVLN